MNQNNISLKIVLCGDPEVGKTTLRARYMGLQFDESYQMTLGVDFSTIMYPMKLKQEPLVTDIYLQIWDMGGQAVFEEIRKTYYKDAHGILLVFDLTKKESLLQLDNWIQELGDFKKNVNHNKYIPIVVLGNKSDLKKDESLSKMFIQEHLLKLSSKYHNNAFRYVETSAKTGKNIDLALKTLINYIIE